MQLTAVRGVQKESHTMIVNRPFSRAAMVVVALVAMLVATPAPAQDPYVDTPGVPDTPGARRVGSAPRTSRNDSAAGTNRAGTAFSSGGNGTARRCADTPVICQASR